ncbi:PREDICTED: carbonic anhydrase 4-like [Cyprinodon variegatus]|nr:PREDICTED: carbonic anhydrase 4-like [Cyprinodon variegatus]
MLASYFQTIQKRWRNGQWISTMELAVVLSLIALSMKFVSASEWCYQSQFSCNNTCTGPNVWQEIFQNCNGRSQSPINIVTRKVHRDERLTPFHFEGYQATFHGRLINNGHTVQLELPSGIRISGGHLTEKYKAVQFHLHWGKEGKPGSEHLIDGEQFPMEMHIVHIKEKYDSLSQAAKDRTGVAVLGFMFQESESNNEKYSPLVDALKRITEPSSNTTLTGVSLEMFIPPQKSLTKYFRYDGSLTTPDCAEAVVWTLFESTIPMSRNQLSAFYQLRFPDGKHMVQIYRPVQPLNGRVVYYSNGYISVASWVLLTSSVLFSSAVL